MNSSHQDSTLHCLSFHELESKSLACHQATSLEVFNMGSINWRSELSLIGLVSWQSPQALVSEKYVAPKIRDLLLSLIDIRCHGIPTWDIIDGKSTRSRVTYIESSISWTLSFKLYEYHVRYTFTHSPSPQAKVIHFVSCLISAL